MRDLEFESTLRVRSLQARGITLSWFHGINGKPTFRRRVTCRDFPRFVIISEKSRPEVGSRVKIFIQKLPFGRKRPLWANFHTFSEGIHGDRSTSCMQISWNLAHQKSVKSRVAYLTKKTKKSPRSRFCADRAQILAGPATNNVLRAPQISSKSVHFRQSYSRTREHLGFTV